MILLSHPTGNTFSRALLQALQTSGQLGLFATTIRIREGAGWLRVLPAKARAELLRRRFEVEEEKLFTRPFREYARLAAGRSGLKAITRHETGWASFDAVYGDLDGAIARELPSLVSRHGLSGVYAYEMGAVRSFSAARALGLARFYDLPIAYWETSQRLLREEGERWRQWESTLLATRDSAEKCERKRLEIELADVVFCPSRFVLNSIPESIRSGRRCVVAEFGSPSLGRRPRFAMPGKKLRILFAGSMTQRKGLADLFAAMKLLKRDDVELVVLGSPGAPMEFYRREFADFIYEPPRPHGQVLELMETCDALALPSIVEGRALVQQEAMSCGLPLIVTPNAGGEDLIEEGKTGFLLPIRSPEIIAERIAWMADNRAALPEMKRAAFERASEVTWSSYCEKILGVIGEFFESRTVAASQ